MSKVALLEPFLEIGIRNTNFFNGRLLSAEDLRAEQTANREHHEHLGRAIGDGIADGLEVYRNSASTEAIINVSSGLAVNRKGQTLALPVDVEVALVRGNPTLEENAGLFAVCPGGVSTAIPATGTGVYILAITAASGFAERAPASGLGETQLTSGKCGSRYAVESVQFRLVELNLNTIAAILPLPLSTIDQLMAAGDAASLAKLRNVLAHTCLGTKELAEFADRPFQQAGGKSVFSKYGALDELRLRGALTDCDVPLALIYWIPAGIQFIDMWSVRRRLTAPVSDAKWPPIISDRNLSDAEALFLQFQEHLTAIQDSPLSKPNFKAEDSFLYLPPGGFLPVGANRFDWKKFFGPMAPPFARQVDEDLARAIVKESFALGAILVKPFADASQADKAPPVPVDVFQIPSQNEVVVFARSRRGRIRVFLTPRPAAGKAVQIYASGPDGAWPGASLDEAGAFPVIDLIPGGYKVKILAEGFEKKRVNDVSAIGGRTTDLAVTLQPLPNGDIEVTVIDLEGRSIGAKVSEVTAKSSSLTQSGTYAAAVDRWRINDLPAGSYAVTVRAPNYVSQTISLNVALGQKAKTTVKLAPVPGVTCNLPKSIVVKANEKMRLPDMTIYMFDEALSFRDLDYQMVKYSMKFSQEESQFLGRENERGAATQAESFAVASEAKGAAQKAPLIEADEALKIVEALRVEAAWLKMTRIPELPDNVKEWLLDWQLCFQKKYPELRLERITPEIFIDPNAKPPRNAADIPLKPQAYAVYGRFGVPLLITFSTKVARQKFSIAKAKMRGLDDDVIVKLEKFGIRNLDQLGGLPAEFTAEVTGQSVEYAQYLAYDAVKTADKVNKEHGYYDDWAAIESAIKQLGFDEAKGIDVDVFIANLDAKELSKALGNDEGFAVRVIDKARSITPAEAWSVKTLGFSRGEELELKKRGIDSLGVFKTRAENEAGKEEIAKAIGIQGQKKEDKEKFITDVAKDAEVKIKDISIVVKGKALVSDVPEVDPLLANKLANAGVFSVKDMLGLAKEDLQRATGLTDAKLNNMIKAGNKFIGRS